MTDRTENRTERAKSLGSTTASKSLPIPGHRSFATSLVFVLSILVVLLSSSITAVNAQKPVTDERSLKAGHLRYLAHNLAIPKTAFAKPGSDLVIGVIGDRALAGILAHLCKGEVVKGHPIRVVNLARGAKINGCHIVFFARGEAKSAAGVIAAVAGRPIFLVGEFTNFCAFGGHLNYLIVRGAMQIEFNSKAAAKAGVRVPSVIQRVGKSVSTRP